MPIWMLHYKEGRTMNFEQLKLQIHMRSLYERLGAMDAELMIVDAFLREQARHDRILRTKQGKDNHVDPTGAIQSYAKPI